jgi:hypothetical protein
MRTRMGWRFARGFVLVILLVGVVGWVTMSLWNWLMPSLFGLPQIMFMQALGLLLLSRLLLGGRHSFGHGFWHARMRERLGERFDERWKGMSSEERERFRSRMRWHFGPCRPGRQTDPEV